MITVNRSDEDYAGAYSASMPTGPAWPRDPASVLMRLILGLAGPWADIDALISDFIETESDPRSTLQMLPDWERALGLPDPCIAEAQTLTDRRKAIVTKLTAEGGQSKAFFIQVAASLGYAIRIREYSPFMAGISRAGDTRSVAPADPTDIYPRWSVGPPEMRFYWTVFVLGAKLRWFRAGSGRAGVDPMLLIGLATDLECVLRRWKPAHTEVIFNYGSVSSTVESYTWFRAGSGRAGMDPMLVITESGGIVDT